jgi:hypothetical protein
MDMAYSASLAAPIGEAPNHFILIALLARSGVRALASTLSWSQAVIKEAELTLNPVCPLVLEVNANNA